MAIFLIIFNKFTVLHLGLQILCMFSCHHHILNEWRGFQPMRSGGKYSTLKFSFLSMLCMAWGYHIFHTGLVLLSNGWKWEEENQKTIRKPIMNFKLKNENEMHKKLFGEIFIRLYSWWCLLRDSQCVQSELLQREDDMWAREFSNMFFTNYQFTFFKAFLHPKCGWKTLFLQSVKTKASSSGVVSVMRIAKSRCLYFVLRE